MLIMLASTAAPAEPIVADTAREARNADQILAQLVVGDPVWLSTPTHPRVFALYAEPADPARGAVVIAHGLGLHPDWGFIGTLRSDLPSHQFATLSVQMPVLAQDASREAYRGLFNDAAGRLAAAIAWLHSKGHARIALVSYSLGASMANAFVANSPKVDAWVAVGFAEDFAAPPTMPVLDVIGERDFPEVIARSRTRQASLPKDRCSRTVTIAAADHYFERETKALEAAIVSFLEQAFAGRC